MRRIPFESNAHGVWDNLDRRAADAPVARRRPGHHHARPGQRAERRPDDRDRAQRPHPRREDPAERARRLRAARRRLPDLVRRAPLRRVGERRLARLHQGEGQVEGVQRRARARADANARRRQGADRLGADDLQHGRGVRHDRDEPRQRRRARPPARRPDQRGLDRPVGRAAQEEGREASTSGRRSAALEHEEAARSPPRGSSTRSTATATFEADWFVMRDARRARTQALVARHPRARSEARADERAATSTG